MEDLAPPGGAGGQTRSPRRGRRRRPRRAHSAARAAFLNAPAEPAGTSRRTRTVWALLVVGVYLGLSISYSLLTPALETNDEPSHLRYVEYVVTNGNLPAIPAEAGGSLEWHQPPGYYFVTAAWQELLGIPAFFPRLVGVPFLNGATPTLVYRHGTYPPAVLRDVERLHLLRLVSVACGLVVVLCALAMAWCLTGSTRLMAATGFTVALWPKLLVLDSSLTNDALANACCALATLAVVRFARRAEARWALLFGFAAAAGAVTKYTTLPVSGLLGVVVLVVALRRRRWWAATAAPAVFVLGSAWLWIRNTIVFGDPLASSVSRRYLAHIAPWLIRSAANPYSPTLWWMVQNQLANSVFFQGGQDQIVLPYDWARALDVFALVCLAACLTRRRNLHGAVLAAALGSLGSWLLIATETTLAEGRYLMVAAGAWALLLVLGTERVHRFAVWIWPGLLAGANVWVFSTYLLPHGGL